MAPFRHFPLSPRHFQVLFRHVPMVRFVSHNFRRFPLAGSLSGFVREQQKKGKKFERPTARFCASQERYLWLSTR